MIVAHSVGTWNTFELLVALRAKGLPLPEHVFLSCFPSVRVPGHAPVGVTGFNSIALIHPGCNPFITCAAGHPAGRAAVDGEQHAARKGRVPE